MKRKNKYIIIVIASFIAVILCYCYRVHQINLNHYHLYNDNSDVSLRKFPYPYKAGLTIANDVDGTKNDVLFLRIQEHLNTDKFSVMGEGVGLEIGNSFFMYGSKKRDDFSYYSSRPNDKKIIKNLIKAGYIDSIHSWGDGFHDRKDAFAAINELKKHNLYMKVWINHSDNKSNLGNWKTTAFGDKKDNKEYHADLTIPYGIRFLWDFSSTNIIGQATPITIDTFIWNYDSEFPIKSLYNIVSSFGKHFIGVIGIWNERYSLHESNDLIEVATLGDGQKVFKFIRYDAHPGGIGYGTDSKNIDYNLSERIFSRLKKVHGYGILYSHLSKNSGCDNDICLKARNSLRLLKREVQKKEIYVTTTYKLLNYYVKYKYLKWSYKYIGESIYIIINCVADPINGDTIPTKEDLQGITFYVPSGKNVKVFIVDKELCNIIKNPVDETGKESVTIPLIHLQYPDLNIGPLNKAS